ncbi:MAG: hypothetical protein U9N06_00620, partial [candidate division WOR-3 bacterium]|nr:hypothetical protein [candidate division WOR-3 bacterium]
MDSLKDKTMLTNKELIKYPLSCHLYKGGCTQKLYHFEMFFCGLQGFFLTLSSLLIQDSFSSFDILSL